MIVTPAMGQSAVRWPLNDVALFRRTYSVVVLS